MVSETTWTLEELGERVKDALATDYVAPGSARVRAVPDARTIRYYTTLGLVDRPELQGRTALYGERHLLQLVAIKRLQADGLTLGQVQERLAGLPEAALRGLAKLPAIERRNAAPVAAEAPRGRREFWREAPASVTPPAPVVSHRDIEHPAQGVTELLAIELGPGVSLVLKDGRGLNQDEVQALRRAAGPLLRLLEDRGLAPGPRSEA